MASWSAENATKAYLKTMKMGQKGKEPNVTEFISAIAAGNTAQLMVAACAGVATSTTLSLIAAAHQTGGRVVCILRGQEELRLSAKFLGENHRRVDFIIGEAQILLPTHLRAADFVLIDCNLKNHEGILRSAQENCRRRGKGAVVVGYNAFSRGLWRSGAAKTRLLPIGDGLLVTRIAANKGGGIGNLRSKKSKWIVKVDKSTGEEHVFRIRSPKSKETQIPPKFDSKIE